MAVKLFHNIVIGLAVLVYGVTAFKSLGYYHFDEHYQIIEFANLKLERTHPNDLAWEYDAKIRSAFQPIIATIVFKGLYAVKLDDPYLQIAILKLLTVVLALYAITLFVKSAFEFVQPKYHRGFIMSSYLLWFLPFLNVRFSSESWSGLLFLLACALVHPRSNRSLAFFAMIGFILGLSFLCRFQTAFLIIGLFGWLITIKKINFFSLFLISIGLILSVLVGTCFDFYFYEELVFTPWNYFRANIVQDVASRFGVSPWYFYLKELACNPGTFVLLISFPVALSTKCRNLLAWIILPFFIAHCLIGHKEIRFLFPLVNFAPLILTLSWQSMNDGMQHFKIRLWRPIAIVFLSVLVFINLVGLAVNSFCAAGNGTKRISYFIHKTYKSERINLLCFPNSSPYNPLYWLNLPETFYRDKNVTELYCEEQMSCTDTAQFSKGLFFVTVQKKMQHSPDFQHLKIRYKLRLLAQSTPAWVEKINDFYMPSRNEQIILLYGK